LSFAQVDSIAQGRIWSGSQALKIGLVDKIGGLDDAIIEAASLAKTQNYKTQNFPEFEKDINDILEHLPFAKSKESFIKEEFGEETYRLMEQIKRVQSQKGVQAMMPFDITIQ
jgi:protease-4